MFDKVRIPISLTLSSQGSEDKGQPDDTQCRSVRPELFSDLEQ
jgi:hypothetical protein